MRARAARLGTVPGEETVAVEASIDGLEELGVEEGSRNFRSLKVTPGTYYGAQITEH
jgi:hypothetical protein